VLELTQVGHRLPTGPTAVPEALCRNEEYSFAQGNSMGRTKNVLPVQDVEVAVITEGEGIVPMSEGEKDANGEGNVHIAIQPQVLMTVLV